MPTRVRPDPAEVIRALAMALAASPGLSFEKLANAAGISRRTLYRMASNREALLELLRREAVLENEEALRRADVDCGSFPQALSVLTREFMAKAELYGFWTADTWKSPGDRDRVSASDRAMAEYRERMTAFFERGRDEGHLLADVPAKWVMLWYDALLAGAAVAIEGDPRRRADLADTIFRTLLHGVGRFAPSGREPLGIAPRSSAFP